MVEVCGVAGNKTTIASFASLGISVQKAASASSYELFGMVSDQLNKIPCAAERARIAYDLFGLRGMELVQVLKLGSQSMSAIREDVVRFGAAVDSSTIAASWDKWEKATTRLGLAWDSVSNTFATVAAPAINLLAAAMEKAATATAFLSKLFVGDAYGASMAAGWTKTSEAAKQAAVRIESVKYTSESARAAAADFMNNPDKYINLGTPDVDYGERVSGYYADLNSKLEALEGKYAKPISAAERYRMEVEDTNRLYEVGMITLEKRNQLLQAGAAAQREEQMKAVAQRREQLREMARRRSDFIVGGLRRGLDERLSAIGRLGSVQGPAALERGTGAAFSAFQQNKAGANVADKQLAEIRRTNAHLAELKRRGIVLAEARI